MDIKTVGCHQPNFLPWLGFFAKLNRSDIFILLDDIQFTHGHNRHNWTTRVRVLAPNGPLFLSIPVRRSGIGMQKIMNLLIDRSNHRWRRKIIETIEQSYKKAPFFEDYFEEIKSILNKDFEHICEMNVELINKIVSILNIETEILRSSNFSIEGKATDRLIALTKAVGGDSYMSGDGAEEYQEKKHFISAGIILKKINFVHPRYQQIHSEEFVPGLSIIDALFNAGEVECKRMIQ